MGYIKSLLKKLLLFLFENIYTRNIVISNDRAIFSFTFDDVLISAATNGASILENFNVTGTYYVALGMESGGDDEDGDARNFIDGTEIVSLSEKGHDIGCHTYGHFNLKETSSDFAITDCRKNIQQLQDILKGPSIDHFAYPYGAVSLNGKKELGRLYETLRTVEHGLNTGKTDLTHLRSVSLCSNTFDRASIQSLIDIAVKKKAWVIFYSHDICEKPTEWGTSTDDFKWVVQQCDQSDGDILNVREAFSKITRQQL